METKENKQTIAKKIGKISLRVMALLLTFVAAVAVTLLISLKMLLIISTPFSICILLWVLL